MSTAQIIWLVVSNMSFIFHSIWDNLSHWLSYFSRWLLHHQPDIISWFKASIIKIIKHLTGFPGDTLAICKFPCYPMTCPQNWTNPTQVYPWIKLCAMVWSTLINPPASMGISTYYWWFGTFGLFFHVLGIIIPIDELIFFQRGRRTNHQPEDVSTATMKISMISHGISWMTRMTIPCHSFGRHFTMGIPRLQDTVLAPPVVVRTRTRSKLQRSCEVDGCHRKAWRMKLRLGAERGRFQHGKTGNDGFTSYTAHIITVVII